MTTERAPRLDVLITRLECRVIGQDRFGNATTENVEGATVWADRRDFRAQDTLGADSIAVSDSRYVVRYDASNPWRAGDEFVDEEGFKRTVRGVSEIAGRNRYLELLARRIA